MSEAQNADCVRVLVCGSRTFDDMGAVCTVLDGMDMFATGNLAVIHGGARGADSLAAEWAKVNGKPEARFPAEWDRHGRRAGYVRNQQMLDEGKPDVVWAFVDKPLADSKGTNMMVRLAADAGVPTYVVQRAHISFGADS